MTIKVDIRIHDGLYIATSEDMLGLFVVARCITDLIEEITEVIVAINKETERKISKVIKNKTRFIGASLIL